ISPPSLISKTFSVAGIAGHSGPTTRNLSAFCSPIPWLKAGLRYNYNLNVIYLDIVEMLDAVVNKNGTIILSSVLSRIDVNCKLSAGTPDPLLMLTNSHTITDLTFHPCVQLDRFAQSKALPFLPPDERFTLMEYHFNPSASKPGTTPPLTAAATAQGPTFEPAFTPRPDVLKDIGVELYLGSVASGCTCLREARALISRLFCFYDLRHFPFRVGTATLRGTFASSDAHPRPTRPAQISFALPAGTLLSVLKIDQLKLSAETYMPYKGMRGRALWRVEWRARGISEWG
ncbi:Mu homology domain containing protein, partial [Lactarius tabidus]